MANIDHKKTAELYLNSDGNGRAEFASAHALLYIGDMIGKLTEALKDVNKTEEVNTGFYIKDLNT